MQSLELVSSAGALANSVTLHIARATNESWQLAVGGKQQNPPAGQNFFRCPSELERGQIAREVISGWPCVAEHAFRPDQPDDVSAIAVVPPAGNG